MSEKNPYKLGLLFRKAVLTNRIPPDRYSSIVLDLCGHLEHILPALSELSRRKLFKDLPLTGSAAEMTLARDRLANEIAELYRDEVALKLIDLVEGVLGFVAPTEDYLNNEDDHRDTLESSSQILPEVSERCDLLREEENDYYLPQGRLRSDAFDSNRYYDKEDTADYADTLDRASRYDLSALGQIGRTLLYQLPPFSVFFTIQLLLAAQDTSVDLASRLNLSRMVFEYHATWPWMPVSFASVAFWAGLLQARQMHRASFRLELCIGAYYSLIIIIATPALIAAVEEASVADEYLGWLVIFSANLLAARVLMNFFSWLRD